MADYRAAVSHQMCHFSDVITATTPEGVGLPARPETEASSVRSLERIQVPTDSATIRLAGPAKGLRPKNRQPVA